jgi:hypothetical protein
VTVARLTLDSYFRSGWMWGEFVLALVFFAALFFPFLENVSYFYGTSTWDLSAIAVLGTVVMTRRMSNARTYTVLARLSTRASYCRGLILATALLRIPLFLFMCALALLARRMTNPTLENILIGAPGLLIINILVAALTVALTSPIGTRRKRMLFLAWVAIVLFSASPIFRLPAPVIAVLSVSRLPLIPVGICYNIGVNSSIDASALPAFFIVALYIAGLIWLASYWLERRELLLH